MILLSLRPKERKQSWTRPSPSAACRRSWRVVCSPASWVPSTVSTSSRALRPSGSAAPRATRTPQSKGSRKTGFPASLTPLILGLRWKFNKPEGWLLSKVFLCWTLPFWSCEMEWVYVFFQVFFFLTQIICLLIIRVSPPASLSFRCQEGFLQHVMSLFLFSHN